MASARNAYLLMNKVNLLEIYYGVYRDDGIEEVKNVLGKIETLPVKIIDTLTDEVFYEAGTLKATNRISLEDAIAVAEANIRDVELVTCDHHEFDALEKEKKMAVLDTVVNIYLRFANWPNSINVTNKTNDINGFALKHSC